MGAREARCKNADQISCNLGLAVFVVSVAKMRFILPLSPWKPGTRRYGPGNEGEQKQSHVFQERVWTGEFHSNGTVTRATSTVARHSQKRPTRRWRERDFVRMSSRATMKNADVVRAPKIAWIHRSKVLSLTLAHGSLYLYIHLDLLDRRTWKTRTKL